MSDSSDAENDIAPLAPELPANRESVMRLQKFLARAGVASRRASEQLIVDGRICVNGRPAMELGMKVRISEDASAPADTVTFDGAPVILRNEKIALMLNKPAGYVTTMEDPQGRPCVASLVPLSRYPGLFPVGRLDRDTTGLLLFSTDGQLGNNLLHPRNHGEKTYLALVLGRPSEEELRRLRAGVQLADGLTQPASVDMLEGDDAARALRCFDFDQAGASGTSHAARKMQKKRTVRGKRRTLVRISITEGRNRQVRRMFDAVGHPVVALHRESFGPLTLAGVPRGEWRLLEAAEIRALESR